MSNIREAAAREIAALNKHAADREHREHRDRRERIATAALQGMLVNTQWLPSGTTYPHIAEYAVRAADALIAELDKPKEGGT